MQQIHGHFARDCKANRHVVSSPVNDKGKEKAKTNGPSPMCNFVNNNLGPSLHDIKNEIRNKGVDKDGFQAPKKTFHHKVSTQLPYASMEIQVSKDKGCIPYFR